MSRKGGEKAKGGWEKVLAQMVFLVDNGYVTVAMNSCTKIA